MDFQQAWQRYDFTESEILAMRWANATDYVLELNYYWELGAKPSRGPAPHDQPVTVTLQNCVMLLVDYGAAVQPLSSANFGTIVGWGRVDPSPWITQHAADGQGWLHLFFQIGATDRIEMVCRGLDVAAAG